MENNVLIDDVYIAVMLLIVFFLLLDVLVLQEVSANNIMDKLFIFIMIAISLIGVIVVLMINNL